jgi:hypothetical protein
MVRLTEVEGFASLVEDTTTGVRRPKHFHEGSPQSPNSHLKRNLNDSHNQHATWSKDNTQYLHSSTEETSLDSHKQSTPEEKESDASTSVRQTGCNILWRKRLHVATL